MITLKQLAALHIDKWSGGAQPNDSQIYYRSTILKIRGFLNDILRITILNNKNDGDKGVPPQAIASYDLTVTRSGGVAKATLTENFLMLPHAAGMYRVFPKDREQGGYDFTYMANPGISSRTKAGNYPTKRYYWIVGRSMYFRGAYSEPTDVMVVVVQQIVAAPDSIGENDFLPISPDQQAEVLARLDQSMMPPVGADKTNNNNPNV